MFGLTDPSLSAYNSKTAEATKMGLVSSERSFPIEITVASFFDEFWKILHVLISTEKDLSNEPNPIFVALVVWEL